MRSPQTLVDLQCATRIRGRRGFVGHRRMWAAPRMLKNNNAPQVPGRRGFVGPGRKHLWLHKRGGPQTVVDAKRATRIRGRRGSVGFTRFWTGPRMLADPK